MSSQDRKATAILAPQLSALVLNIKKRTNCNEFKRALHKTIFYVLLAALARFRLYHFSHLHT